MKILMVLSRFPYPLEKGDKLRAYHQIRCLSEHHEIFLAAMHDKPVSDEDLRQLEPFCKEIFLLYNNNLKRCWNMGRAFFKGLPIQCGLFYNKANARQLEDIVRKVQPDHIYCQLFRMAEYVKALPLPKTLDYQDVFSKGMARRADNAHGLKKAFFRMEARRVARYEEHLFDLFDHTTIITAVDRDLIPHPRNREIEVVPNGVDFNQFSYHGETKAYDLIFSGNMGYAPNVDAAEYLATEILPPLLDEFPDIRLVLGGANPSARVRALRSEHVIVTGWVDSMADWYAQSKVFIAPMRMGTGLQNKLLEAMSMQLPCVTSPLAAKPLSDAEMENAVCVCHNTYDYVEAIRQLLRDEEAYQRLSAAGNRFVHERYDWKNAADKLLQIIAQ